MLSAGDRNLSFRRKLLFTLAGMVILFAAARLAVLAEIFLQKHWCIETMAFPSIELCACLVHGYKWHAATALIQFPIYAGLFLLTWSHGRLWRGFAVVGIVHVVNMTLAFLIVWPYLIRK